MDGEATLGFNASRQAEHWKKTMIVPLPVSKMRKNLKKANIPPLGNFLRNRGLGSQRLLVIVPMSSLSVELQWPKSSGYGCVRFYMNAFQVLVKNRVRKWQNSKVLIGLLEVALWSARLWWFGFCATLYWKLLVWKLLYKGGKNRPILTSGYEKNGELALLLWVRLRKVDNCPGAVRHL